MEDQFKFPFQITLANVQKSSAGNTKLFHRTEPPPLDESVAPGQADGEYLGIVVLAPSVPRWMSPHFADALKAHDDGVKGADLNLYSQDWFEKIVYIPGRYVPDDEALKALDPFILPQELVNHSLSTGCQQLTARTRIQPVKFDGNSLVTASEDIQDDPRIYYAIVSKHSEPDKTKVTEIIVTTLENIGKFAASDIHKQRLADSCELRHSALVNGTITRERYRLYDALRASHHTP